MNYLTIQYVAISVIWYAYSPEAVHLPHPITPSDMRFAAMRCLGNASLLHHLQANNAQGSCAIKCFLMKLGMIDLESRGFNIRKLISTWRQNIYNTSIDVQCLGNFWLDEPLNDLCVSYRNKCVEFHANCPELFKSTFMDYDPTGNSKNQDESALEFCEAIDAKNKSLQYCVLKEFHYFDGHGRVDENEVIQSYNEAQSLTPHLKVLVKACVHYANTLHDDYEEMSSVLIKCLKKRTKIFHRVYMRRNNLSRQY